MKISEIKKLNIQDGDIIFLPQEMIDSDSLSYMYSEIHHFLPDKKYVIICLPKQVIESMKVISEVTFKGDK